MCLLIASPDGIPVAMERIQTANVANPDGIGIVSASAGKLHYAKMLTPIQAFEVVQAIAGNPYLLHLRYATHGGKNADNCHPFPIGENWSIAHNGVLSIPTFGDESDTRTFARIIEPMMRTHTTMCPEFLSDIEYQIGTGNKIAFLSAMGEVAIANERLGHWDNGVWYSNTSYQSCRYDMWTPTRRKRKPTVTLDTSIFDDDLEQKIELLREEGYDIETSADIEDIQCGRYDQELTYILQLQEDEKQWR